MLSVLNFFRGWLIIEVHGAYIERFFNICTAAGIGFWGMEHVTQDTLRLCVTVEGFKRLRRCAGRAMCRVHITEKHGIRFFTHRFKKRGVLIAGLALVITAIWVMTSFVWHIDISAYDGADLDTLHEFLEENGVRIGVRSAKIDIDSMKDRAYIRMPELSYFGINFNGSRAYVHIRERVVPPAVEKEGDEPSNIIAKRGGIITSVVVQNGTPEVQKGDTVVPGQLLASGFMTGRTGVTVPMRAKAQVYARTWHTVTSVMPLEARFKTRTGRELRRHTLILGEKRIKLYVNSRIPYEECDKIINTAVMTLPGGIKIPLKLECETLCEYVSAQEEIPLEAALEYLAHGLENAVSPGEDGQVLERRYTAGFEDGKAQVTVVAECLEQIGTEQKTAKASE